MVDRLGGSLSKKSGASVSRLCRWWWSCRQGQAGEDDWRGKKNRDPCKSAKDGASLSINCDEARIFELVIEMGGKRRQMEKRKVGGRDVGGLDGTGFWQLSRCRERIGTMWMAGRGSKASRARIAGPGWVGTGRVARGTRWWLLEADCCLRLWHQRWHLSALPPHARAVPVGCARGSSPDFGPEYPLLLLTSPLRHHVVLRCGC